MPKTPQYYVREHGVLVCATKCLSMNVAYVFVCRHRYRLTDKSRVECLIPILASALAEVTHSLETNAVVARNHQTHHNRRPRRRCRHRRRLRRRRRHFSNRASKV